ncbi:MAG: hypothetical protein ABI947_13775 [Chloroflexota bacterium]
MPQTATLTGWITNPPEVTLTLHAIQHENTVRWNIEQLHRDLKQLTSAQSCECRKARFQRNHLAYCYHVWLSLKVKAPPLSKTLYAAQHDLWPDYLRTELPYPQIPTF